MAWKETCPVEQRVQFIRELKAGTRNMAALCRAFGISRQTGYKWWRRYEEAGGGYKALLERPRRPKRSPGRISEAVEDAIVRARRKHRTWGPRKLRTWLRERRPQVPWPAASTIGEILKRHGLTRPRRKRRRTPPFTQPFAAARRPNDVWCIDFKGHFKTGDGSVCYPLTVVDASTRYLLCCRVMKQTDGDAVRKVLEGVFAEYGVPRAIRSDNGPPFASVGGGGLSELSAWWVRLGIRPERIQPGKPQQNGRQERLHGTMAVELAVVTGRTLREQQRLFDRFRRTYNDERPHEALQMQPPGRFYKPSTRRMKEKYQLVPKDCEEAWINCAGAFGWHGVSVLVNRALSGRSVALRRAGDGLWEIFYGPVLLGLLDEADLRKGVRRLRSPLRRPKWTLDEGAESTETTPSRGPAAGARAR